MVFDFIAQFDTYIYAMASLIVWNFIWTMRLRNKVFGLGKDPSEDGIAIEVKQLKNDNEDK